MQAKLEEMPEPWWYSVTVLARNAEVSFGEMLGAMSGDDDPPRIKGFGLTLVALIMGYAKDAEAARQAAFDRASMEASRPQPT